MQGTKGLSAPDRYITGPITPTGTKNYPKKAVKKKEQKVPKAFGPIVPPKGLKASKKC